jgi:hypothetical protein
VELPNIVVIRLVPLAPVEPELTAATAEAMVSDRIHMSMEPQRGTQWCWAAVAVSFQNHLGTGTFTQCSLVKEELGHDHHECCDNDPPLDECDKDAALADGFDKVGVAFNVQSSALLFSEVKTQISTHRKPVACFIDFPSKPIGHFVEIDGYVDGSPGTYIVNDPERGEVRSPADEMVFNYANKGGIWKQTFLLV